MSKLNFAVAVGITSVVLVGAIVLGGLLVVRNAVASAPFGGPPMAAAAYFAGHGAGGPGFQIPTELQDLGNLPPDQRFAHFEGVQVNLKDKNNKDLTVNVTPGTVTTASATSLTIAANDGSTKTFALGSDTAIRGKPAQGSQQPAQVNPANGDQVVVVTLSSQPAAMAVIDGGKDGFTSGGPGPWGNQGPWHR